MEGDDERARDWPFSEPTTDRSKRQSTHTDQNESALAPFAFAFFLLFVFCLCSGLPLFVCLPFFTPCSSFLLSNISIFDIPRGRLLYEMR